MQAAASSIEQSGAQIRCFSPPRLMAQMSAAVAVLAALVWAGVPARTLEDVVLPEGLGGEEQGKSIKASDSIHQQHFPPWLIVVRADEVWPDLPDDLQKPSKHYEVYNMRIGYRLCERVGIFAMFQNCDYFFICTHNNGSTGGKFHQYVGVCHSGHKFDEQIQDCIKKPCDTAVQNDPIRIPFSPVGPPGEPSPYPPPVTQQVPSWMREEPAWYSRQPAFFKTPPSWYYIPPAWYNTPPAWYNNLPTTHKTGEQKP